MIRARMPRLLWSTSSGAHELTLQHDAVVGRSATADIVIDDDTVSRRHAQLIVRGDDVSVEDLGSGNGTAVNGVIIRTRTPLREGDEILLGKVTLTVRDIAGLAASSSVVFAEHAAESLAELETGSVRSGEPLTASVRLRHIAELASSLSAAASEESIFNTVSDRLFTMFGQAERVCVVLRDVETLELRPRLARSRGGDAEQIPLSRTVLDRVINERKALVCADATGDDRFAQSGTMLQYSLRTFAAVPMIASDAVLGAIQIDTSDPARAFSEDDVATLLAVGAQTALTVANRRMQQALITQEIVAQDLVLAKRIQSRFLPEDPPDLPGYGFAWAYNPALGVGGDYFDFIRIDDRQHAIVIADVSGKGVSAALYMAKLSSEMRHHAVPKTKACDMVRRLNKALMGDFEEGMFVTLLLMLLDSATGELQVVSAGHQSPIVRRSDGDTLQLLVPQNSPLGMANYGGFQQETFTLSKGDVVTAYTDGVSEAMNEEKSVFGEARLFSTIEITPGPPDAVKEAILSAVSKHRGAAAPNDDLTLICFGPIA